MSTGRENGGRPQRVNQDVLDEMSRLRRRGYTIREVAEKVGRSERTVRRYVKGIEPQVKARSDLGSAQLMDWFYDQVLDRRRTLIVFAHNRWDEVVELGVEVIDETARALRKRVSVMDEITVNRMASDEDYRREYFEEFIAPVVKKWMEHLILLRQWAHMAEAAGPGAFVEDDYDGHEFSDRAR